MVEPQFGICNCQLKYKIENTVKIECNITYIFVFCTNKEQKIITFVELAGLTKIN